MTKEEFYSKVLTFDEVGEQVDIFKEEKEKYQQEIERLNNVINEAIEYIESDYIVEEVGVCKSYITIDKEKLLEILDKGE